MPATRIDAEEKNRQGDAMVVVVASERIVGSAPTVLEVRAASLGVAHGRGDGVPGVSHVKRYARPLF